jgi:hypothetical protein
MMEMPEFWGFVEDTCIACNFDYDKTKSALEKKYGTFPVRFASMDQEIVVGGLDKDKLAYVSRIGRKGYSFGHSVMGAVVMNKLTASG